MYFYLLEIISPYVHLIKKFSMVSPELFTHLSKFNSKVNNFVSSSIIESQYFNVSSNHLFRSQSHLICCTAITCASALHGIVYQRKSSNRFIKNLFFLPYIHTLKYIPLNLDKGKSLSI